MAMISCNFQPKQLPMSPVNGASCKVLISRNIGASMTLFEIPWFQLDDGTREMTSKHYEKSPMFLRRTEYSLDQTLEGIYGV